MHLVFLFCITTTAMRFRGFFVEFFPRSNVECLCFFCYLYYTYTKFLLVTFFFVFSVFDEAIQRPEKKIDKKKCAAYLNH